MYSRRTVCYSPVHAWLGLRYIQLFTAFRVGARTKHSCALCVLKTRTARNVLNGAGRTHRNRAIVHKQLSGFSDFNAGLLLWKGSK